MVDMLQSESANIALAIGRLLEEHRGADVIVMDMRNLNFWTDFFVITTVMSSTHLAGLDKHIKDFTKDRGIEILRRSKKPTANAGINAKGAFFSESGSEEWSVIDLGDIVIHLMSSGSRSFFELERLWSAAVIMYQSENSLTKKPLA